MYIAETQDEKTILHRTRLVMSPSTFFYTALQSVCNFPRASCLTGIVYRAHSVILSLCVSLYICPSLCLSVFLSVCLSLLLCLSVSDISETYISGFLFFYSLANTLKRRISPPAIYRCKQHGNVNSSTFTTLERKPH